MTDAVYDRAVLVDVLVYHYRVAPGKGCGCGWDELGRSWPEHVATMLEASVTGLVPDATPELVPACLSPAIDADAQPPCGSSFRFLHDDCVAIIECRGHNTHGQCLGVIGWSDAEWSEE